MVDAMQWFQLNGKKAMVTGGAAGLCYAMAEGLHLAGAEVVLVDRSPAVGEAAARLGAQGAPVHGVQGDLSHWEGIPALYDRALAALGAGWTSWSTARGSSTAARQRTSPRSGGSRS